MATQITFDSVDDSYTRFNKAVSVAIAACGRGFRGKVAVSMSDITGIGGDALSLFKHEIDVRACTNFMLTADPDADLVCIEPAAVPASMPSTEDAAKGTKRPKNAFVIFRLDNHEQVKALNPGIHNNDISVIIGRMWRDASPEVKATYKKKAEEEKRQHAIDHPGYKYQPRKPSEKKKRMTKNKLAKLAAQSSSTDATTNATNLPAQQNGQTTVNTSMPPDQNDTSQLITHNDDPLGSFNVVQGPQSPAWDIFLPADELSYMAGERAEQLRQERFVGETEDVDSWFDMVAYVEGLGPVQDWVNDNA